MMNCARCYPTDPTAELASRTLARRSLLDFTTYTYAHYKPEPVHGLIAQTLDGVLTGNTERLMIFAPPQHGKSELASVRFPAYWLGRRPDEPVMLTSYAAGLAHAKSREARGLVESPEFQRLFPDVNTRRDSRAVDDWRIADHRGGLLAAGVGGAITGHGARLGIIDDPVENWQQAQSQTYRDRAWDWFRATFRSRIREGGRIVLIMTRWHEDDLAGRLLQDQPDKWSVLRLPAIAETPEDRAEANRRLNLNDQGDPLGREPGEALAPGRFSRQTLLEIKRDAGTIVWSTVYQQLPIALQGTMFKRSWFEIVDTAPARFEHVIRYWDKAGTHGDGDYSAGVLMGRARGLYFVLDVVRGQWSAGERERVMLQTAKMDADAHERYTVWVEQEPGSGGKESAQATVKNLAGFSVHTEPVTGDKTTRAMPLMAQCEGENVKLLRGRWCAQYMDELTAFPNGAHDDQVDASSGAFNKLAQGRHSLKIVTGASLYGSRR